MKKKGNILGVIPARGGSKGVPRKNICDLAGKPLIAYTIEAALKSKLLDRVIVSTDDDEIAAIARKYGAEVPFMRPAELATDTAHTPPVIEHTVSWLEENENYNVYAIVLLQPTSPLRTVEHIDIAIEKFLKQNCDSLVSVKKGYPPWWLWKIEDEKIIPFMEYKKGVNARDLERQQLPAVYCPDGAIYVFKREFLKKAKTIISASDCSYVILDEESSLDIDSEIDFKIIDEIIKKEKMFEKIIRIGNREVGKGKPVFIIAEAGVNHNGRLDLAKKMVDVAKEAGADAVKFQTFKTELVMTKDVEMAPYQKKNTGKGQTQYEMVKKLELSEDDFREIKRYCDDKEIMFLSTPHSNEYGVDLLDELGVEAYKVASGDLTNLPFLKYLSSRKKPIILSTGMATLEEVADAVDMIRKSGNEDLILLHCTTNYPCPIGEVNLNAMLTLKDKFGTLVGYSDHTLGIEVPIMATALGACVIEKHFTLDKNMEGPDHKASLEPDEFKEMVEKIRYAERVLGSGIKEPSKSELEIAKVARKSIVAFKDIKKGQTITKDMLIIKRPGTGIKPKYIDTVIGKISKEKVKKDELIDYNKLM